MSNKSQVDSIEHATRKVEKNKKKEQKPFM